MKYLGIDLGGTNVAAAVVDSEGTILGKVSLPTPRGAEAVADQMAAAARGAAEAAGTALDEVASVGIGAPGAIEPDTGVIKYWSNLDFTNVPITALMKARLDKEILLENDANAAALGEYAAGAGKGSQSMVAVTLGTGVGGGAILNGKLYTGFNYAGMEIGHFVIEHGGRLCTCGRRGCFEAYCSATALIKRTRQVMEEDRTSRLWDFEEMGVEIYATSGTCDALTEAGIQCKRVNRVSQAHPNILDMIQSGTVDLIINTPTKGRKQDSDGFKIRRSAVEHSVACVTAIDTARAVLTVREQSRSEDLTPIDITKI